MATFETAKDVEKLDPYKMKLKVAIRQLKPGKPSKFIYYKSLPFIGSPPTPCLLIDYAEKCSEQISVKSKVRGVTGQVFKDDDDRLLFKAPGFDPGQVQKLFKAWGAGFPEVVDPDAQTKDAAPQDPAASALPIPQNLPSLPPTPQKSAKAAVPAAGTLPIPQNLPTLPPTPQKSAKAAVPAASTPPAKTGTPDKTAVKAGTPPPARPTTSRPNTIPGVPLWVTDPVKRKYKREELYEHIVALTNLLDQMESDGKKPPQDLKDALSKMPGRLLGIDAEIKAALDKSAKDEGKGIRPVLDRLVKAWEALDQDRNDKAKAIKPLWLEGKREQVGKEINRDAVAYKMVEGYGAGSGGDTVCELAQMAEVQARTYLKNGKGKKEEFAKVSHCEMAAIYGYSTADYTVVGDLLRGNLPADKAAEARAKFDAYIEATKNGLAKLPTYKGKAVRCTKDLWQGAIDAFAGTGVYAEPSFMSCGTKEVPGFGDIEWTFDPHKSGKNISMFSLHQSEGEVLFPPGCRFQLVGADLTVEQGGRQIQVTIAQGQHKALGQYTPAQIKKAKLRLKEG